MTADGDRARRDAEQDCRDLICALAHHADTRQGEAAATLFAPDGSWLRGAQLLTGQAQIAAAVGAASDDIVRHFATNARVRVGTGEAVAVTYYMLLRGQGDGPPYPLDLPATAGEWHDRLVLTADGWRFGHRETRRLFQRRSA